MEDGWLKDNMGNILAGISIFSAVCVAAIFVVYFTVKRRLAKKRKEDANRAR